jgi:hypothetical protein
VKKLRAKEIQGVLNTDGPTRYAHFVKQVADWQQVWGLRASDGWVSVSDESGIPMFPVWPHPHYAQLAAIDGWENAAPASIEVHEWVQTWLPGLTVDGSMIAVFPTPQLNGVVVAPEMLKTDIENELVKLE